MLQTALQRQQAAAENEARERAALEAAHAQDLDNARTEAQLQVSTYCLSHAGYTQACHIPAETAALISVWTTIH